MIDSLEKLALSCTFRVVDGTLAETIEPDAGLGSELPAGLIVDGKYKIESLLGRGGMGAVYKAHHEMLLKPVALKTLSQQNLSGESWQRFQQEARAIAKLRHKNIVEVFDFGVVSQEFSYYTMELLEGESLAERLRAKGPEEIAAAINIFISVAEALAHAHRQKIVHRDIKPGNIYLAKSTPAGKGEPLVKIVDFGIAKLITDNSTEAQSSTLSGLVFGSPLYMSPEQGLGTEVDQRTDIYSFGCTLFEVLTGQPPFVGDSLFATILAHQTQTPPRLSDVARGQVFPERLEALVAKLLAKQPQRRYQDFDEVKEALALCLATPAQVASDLKGKRGSTYGGSIESYSTLGEGRPAETDGSGAVKKIALIAALIAGLCAACLFYMHPWHDDAIKKEEARIASVNQAKKALAEEAGKYTPARAEKDDIGDFKMTFNAINKYPLQPNPTGNIKVIVFPQRDSQAKIMIDGQGETQTWCRGACSFPVSAPLYLLCFDGMKPEFLEGFRKDDLFGLALHSTNVVEWNDQHFQAISQLTELRKLVINNCTVTSKGFSYLLNLRRLTELRVLNTECTGAELARTLDLPDLTYLDAGGKHEGMIDLLKKLPSAKKLDTLFICGSQLTDEDMKWLAAVPHLNRLGLDDNPITLRGLEILADKADLMRLSLKRIVLPLSSIDTFKRFRHLHVLCLYGPPWSPVDKHRLQEALPNCQIVWTGEKYANIHPDDFKP